MATLSNLHVIPWYWFYPTGNTPAVNLLRDTRIEQDEAIEILSLGCGDARNLLYTAWCEDTCRLNFTCCDLEAAVLARNIVLFATLIPAKNKPDYGQLWKLYYHLFIPNADAKFLLDLLEDLLATSSSLTQWASSSYGCAVTFSNQSTLEEVRALWQRYKAIIELTGDNKSLFETKVKSEYAEIAEKKTESQIVLTGMRTSGAPSMQALEAVPIAFRRFWKTGVAAGNKEDLLELKNGSVVNPLFAVSSSPTNSITVHYGTDPLLGFHLAEAYAMSDIDITLSHMVSTAKRQFGSWCKAFESGISSGRLKCIYHRGEAMVFCQKLQWLPETSLPLFTAPGACTELLLPVFQDSPRSFDVIDTSNLVDHYGSLPLLAATIPLLSERPTSVLYCESLLQAAKEPKDSLDAMLLSDTTTSCLLFGLAPSGFLTGVSTDMTSANDIFSVSILDSVGKSRRQAQLLIRMPWRFTAFGHGAFPESNVRPTGMLQFDCADLTEYFVALYLRMFAREDITQLTQHMGRMIRSPQSADIIRHTRVHFAMVLALAKRNIQTNWPQLMSNLVKRISEDENLAFGRKSLQELFMWLHFLGIHSESHFCSPLQDDLYFSSCSSEARKRLSVLFNNRRPPTTVYLTLSVPRSKMRLILDASREKIGTATLHLEVKNVERSLTSCFQAMTGFDQTSCKAKRPSTTTTEEPSAFNIVCAVPSYILLSRSPRDICITLRVNPSPLTISLIKDLGFALNIYETNLADDEHVQVLLQPLRFAANRDECLPKMSFLGIKDQQPIFVEFASKGRAEILSAHLDLPRAERQSQLLASGAEISIKRTGPLGLDLKIGDTAQSIKFPYPVNIDAAKLRIARKSSWIEVKVPLSPAGHTGGFDPEHFPIVLAGTHVVPWGIQTINLDKSVLISQETNTNWVDNTLGLSLSAKDRAANRAHSPSKSPLLDLKESLYLIFAGFLGRHPLALGKSIPGFQLIDYRGVCDTILILNSFCHDASSSSIAIDAHVICVSHDRMHSMGPALISLPFNAFATIDMSKKEEVLWKQLLPALVERARGSQWKHGKHCEYLKMKKIPLSVEHGKAPICSCGEGKALNTYNKTRGLKPSSKFATRLALVPLAAVPYVEQISDASLEVAVQSQGSAEGHSDAPKCNSCGKSSGELKNCSGCGNTKYCNRQCQRADWKRHKAQCLRK